MTCFLKCKLFSSKRSFTLIKTPLTPLETNCLIGHLTHWTRDQQNPNFTCMNQSRIVQGQESAYEVISEIWLLILLQLVKASKNNTLSYLDCRPVHLQAVIGDPRKHFLLKYPRLFMAVFEIVRDSDWKERRLLTDFFQPRKEDCWDVDFNSNTRLSWKLFEKSYSMKRFSLAFCTQHLHYIYILYCLTKIMNILA